MREKMEFEEVGREAEPSPEELKSYPEIYANPSLKETSLVYAVPAMGEWENGNLPRLLHAMFSQRTESTKPFELEIITNIGGRFGEKETLLEEAKKSVAFLRKLVEIQKLARTSKRGDATASQQLREKIDSIDDILLRDIAELASTKAEKISLVAVDATHTDFSKTEYREPGIGTFRTLGADIAAGRFKDPKTVVALFDVDSLVEGNRSVEQIENIFENNPQLHYFFSGMAYLPGGHSEEFVASSPKESTGRMMNYNSQSFRGSPQIYFRLSSYEKLQEISAGPTHSGFQGHEDYDTGRKLVYYFGQLQEGLLLEGSYFMPASLTSDRIDGFMDSVVRRGNFIEGNGSASLVEDVKRLEGFKKEVASFAEKMSLPEREKVLQELEDARTYYLKRQRVQQRFNKTVLGSFLEASEKGFIKLAGKKVEIDEKKVFKMRGGKAMLHYAKANPEIVREVLSSEDDQYVIKYFLGKEKNLPDKKLTPFQSAMREYLGDISPIESSVDNLEDIRPENSKNSLLHPFVAETLAYGHIYAKYFEAPDLLPTDQEYVNPGESRGMKVYDWPKNRASKEIETRFGAQAQRRQIASQQVAVMQNKFPTEKRGWLLGIKSMPMLRMFKKLVGD